MFPNTLHQVPNKPSVSQQERVVEPHAFAQLFNLFRRCIHAELGNRRVAGCHVHYGKHDERGSKQNGNQHQNPFYNVL